MYKLDLRCIDKLVIFAAGEVIFEKERSLRENVTFDGKIGKNMDVLNAFILPEEPKNARKENLSRKDAYFLKYAPDYCKWEKRTAVYIPAAWVSVDDLGEVVAMKGSGETNYKHVYRLTFPAGVEYTQQHVERLHVSGGWTIPADEIADGWHWSAFLGDHDKSYSTVSDFLIKKKNLEHNVCKWWKTDEIKTDVFYESDYYTRTEKENSRALQIIRSV